MTRVVRWSELADPAPIAALRGETMDELAARIAELPDGIHGVALIDDAGAVIAAGIVVELLVAKDGKLALAQLVERAPRAALPLVRWAEDRARALGAGRLEASLRRPGPLDAALEADGWRAANTIVKLRRGPRRATPPLPPWFAERPFDPAADADAYVSVHNESFRDVPFSGPTTREAILAQAALPGFDPGLIRLLVDAAGVCGFLHGELRPGGEGVVATIGLLARARGAGLGRYLLRRCEQLLDERGATTVWLSVAGSNAPARSLYLAEGYAEEERKTVWERAFSP